MGFGLFPLDKSAVETLRWAAMKRVLPGMIMLVTGVTIGFGVAVLLRPHAPVEKASAQTAARTLTLTISAKVDGSERFIFTRENVYDEHGRWQAPKDVIFNGEPWADLSAPPPGWEKLAANLDLTN